MATRGLGPLARRGLRVRWSDRVNLLTLVVGVLAGFFIETGSPIVLFVMIPIAALGLDGVLRAHPNGRLRSPAAAVSQLLGPVAFVVGAALFFRYVASGYWSVLAAFGTGLAFGGICYAEYFSLDADESRSGAARLLLVSADYAGLFALLSAFYAFDLALPAAAALAALAGAIFAYDIFRDAELSPSDTVVYSLAGGFLLAQLRWAAGFLAIDGLLAALLLLMVYYVATGLTFSSLTRRLDRRVTAEYLLVGGAGLLIVLVGWLITGA
jgi:hypothetical protein